MSALWQRQPLSLTSSAEARQPLELRQMPFVAYDMYLNKDTHMFTILGDLFKSFRTSWMYGATIQLTLNGSEPAWSKDGWSFVPVDLSDVIGSDLLRDQELTAVNIQVQTPGVRARLECDQGIYVDDCWMPGTTTITNSTRWEEVTDPSRFPVGYPLDTDIVFSTDASASNSACNSAYNNTSILPQGRIPICCTQGSKDNPGTLSIGYWTPISIDSSAFNIKWMHGLAQTFDLAPNIASYTEPERPYLFWLEKPRLAMTNCTAVIETTNAHVNVSIASGKVYDYTHDEPIVDTNAWAEPFIERQPYSNNTAYEVFGNITTT